MDGCPAHGHFAHLVQNPKEKHAQKSGTNQSGHGRDAHNFHFRIPIGHKNRAEFNWDPVGTLLEVALTGAQDDQRY